jgi:carbamate kinase
MLIVVAIGGNALLHRREPLEADIQKHNIKQAANSIGKLSVSHDLMIVHGNGPQIGLLALQAMNYKETTPYPFDILNAETQGMIGYMLQQEIANHLIDKKIVTLLTQVVVNKDDAAFNNPTKPIGPAYSKGVAEQLAVTYHWQIKQDGQFYRRVVPSPEPQQIVELETIKLLAQQQIITICAGGGGIPVVKTADGNLQGIEAVIDKDLSAALLAIHLQADGLIILTDVKNVERHWGTPKSQPIIKITPKELRQLSFEAGSMAPKIEAACRFVEQTNGWAAIGALEDGFNILNKTAGTYISRM